MNELTSNVGEYGSRVESVINSALWAAAGDALGWMTELSHGTSGVKRRTGATVVKEPVAWQRVIGGRNGPRVDLPSGTYSDDTQLRLAVSRSIRGNGAFDVETFAKVELPVWPTYALGGGLGTKAAAVSLSKRGTNWFSNFFESKDQKYVNGGGNGAAMRIQPHVWATQNSSDKLVLDVLKDALVTHGHPHGFCGAVFHALTLAHAINKREIPGPEQWFDFVNRFEKITTDISSDPQLAAFWISAWESSTKISLKNALEKTISEAYRDIDSVLHLLDEAKDSSYQEVLRRIGCLSVEFRGSGFKTALAAAALSYMFRAAPIEEALRCAANQLESDTDTIATMAGAILGSVSQVRPVWAIQDRDYIVIEAKRLATIANRGTADSFGYPDIGLWNPPASQTASIGLFDGNLVIVGLGTLEPTGKEYVAGDAVWQWSKLSFGQTILGKRKADSLSTISADQLPRNYQSSIQQRRPIGMEFVQPSLLESTPLESSKLQGSRGYSDRSDVVDIATDEIIASNFDDSTIGRILNSLINRGHPIDTVIAVTAIVAKAKIARQRRGR